MTVFDRIQNMPKDELQKLILCIYHFGHINEQCGVDGDVFFKFFLDMPQGRVDELIDEYNNLELVTIRMLDIESGDINHITYKFFDVADATEYLTQYVPNLVKVDEVTYTTSTTVYKIVTCGSGKLS